MRKQQQAPMSKYMASTFRLGSDVRNEEIIQFPFYLFRR